VKIKPVENTSEPQYPDKYGEEIRQVLKAAKPYRWLNTPIVGVMSAALAISMSGCGVDSDGSGGFRFLGIPFSSNKTQDYKDTVLLGNVFTPPPNESEMLISLDMLIPLFEYGEGTGVIGCVAIAAPVFLSEEEALAVVLAAINEADMSLFWGAAELRNARLPVTNLYETGVVEGNNKTISGNLTPDRAIWRNSLLIPMFFVSKSDIEAWHEDQGYMASVSVYDIKRAAQTLADNNPGLVVFYDPISLVDYSELWEITKMDGESDKDYEARWSAKMHELTQAARAESESLLRQQVEAFVKWYREVG